ncbi:5757_t:CDS:1, partial [Cetraspora pellucida]
MSPATVFTKSVLKTKKQSKVKLLFLVLGRIIKNNPFLFFFCSLLAIITALVNFNIGVNLKNALLSREKVLSEKVIKAVEKEGGGKKEEITKERVREILNSEADETDRQQKETKENIAGEMQGEGSLSKKEVKEIIEKASVGGRQ